MEITYSPQLRTERVITLCRFIIVAFSLLALLLDPLDPPRVSLQASRFLGGYLIYSSLLWLLLRLLPLEAAKLGIITHIIDILAFSLLVNITMGAASPFFPYFVFTVFCSALRWQQRGVYWTALAFLFPFLSMEFNSDALLNSSDDQIGRLIIRATHLTVIALLLVYMTTYERHMRKELGLLAKWPSKIADFPEHEVFLHELLVNATQVMNAPRLLMIWREQSDIHSKIAYMKAGEFSYYVDRQNIYGPFISEGFEDCHFLCAHAERSRTKVLTTKAGEWQYGDFSPLPAYLVNHFDIRHVIALKLEGQRFQGRLLVLDKSGMTPDDLTLGMLLAQQITKMFDQRIAVDDLRKVSAAEERIKMARDLHDGLLQTLTGIALQIEILRRLFEKDSRSALRQLGQVQNLIVDEQRNLRQYISNLKPQPIFAEPDQHNMSERLHKLAESIQQLWGLKITLTLPKPDTLPKIPEDIYNVIRESLINCARHAHATHARVTLEAEETRLRIFVSDNGKGFPFEGHYELAELMAFDQGPKSLMERLLALQGQLSLDSGASGAKLTISVPLSVSQQGDAFSIVSGLTVQSN